ncbi:uncharacterized protein LOC118644710 [Monomorium pharaonis]|uniref:uncharacterized protein LOC118644710 n=1 Tax=Monomorium pharaonis TaxID=307658 RepID=UPI0017475885|nr:uncharacterized protein LOC118644710 [Monomorium pharaonis]
MARRAFTKPSLNITGKNAAESAQVDEFLFGQDFSQTLKAAQACEKAGREAVKATQPVDKKTLQPVRQQALQRRSQQVPTGTLGNQKVPAKLRSARSAGASYQHSRRLNPDPRHDSITKQAHVTLLPHVRPTEV